MSIDRIVVAPSGFKECLSAPDTAAAIVAGVQRVLPHADVQSLPLVDGGEGSARALAEATGGRVHSVRVTGPVGTVVDSHFAMLGGSGPRTAVVEMAAAAGLSLVPRDLRDPGATTSHGVGELIRAALDAGAQRILVGCGDSGICDGGAGALQALGARITDAMGVPVGRGGAALTEVESIDLSRLDPRIRSTEIRVAVNPFNVLCGEQGVARVFGPQKGAAPAQVELLSAAMERWAKVLDRDLHRDLRTAPGSGASGGLGAGLAAGLDAVLLPRYEVMFDHVDLDGAIADADLVLTAEGAIDQQTPRGKIPAEVARLASRHGVPVVALAGTIGERAHLNYDAGIHAIASILPTALPWDEAIAGGARYLTDAPERVLRLLLVGATLSA
ncbi:glycerate kinase family protein [Gordonia hydrophobica]|uniref:Glycerate kinase n=1 Tax=Gordonia hydrophobica TaxID=40516 RepID=A0ABZ2U542_9ACTN|nr:glycerate kinase [Gordonia hydrophobica]MBM7368626.1 glycerate kinase [Gordonia hydrophobica]